MKVALFVIIAFVGTAAGLQCFECNSAVDSSCSDDFKYDSPSVLAAFNTTCSPPAGATAFCRKVKMWFEVKSEYRVQRDCGYMRREEKLCYQQRQTDYIVDTCQCDGDLCNTAAGTSGSVALITALASAVAALAIR